VAALLTFKDALFGLLIAASVSGCSIQLGGVSNVYQAPAYSSVNEVAQITVDPEKFTLLSIDGQSATDDNTNKPIILKPGKHTLSLYLGDNNYVADSNTMIVLSGDFKANERYTLQANSAGTAWIEDASGHKLGSGGSATKFSKSTTL
tara:strand:+ start:19237 stop:19680 length:444 start_codon:yes stop_codon:yes gene_type:complete